MNRCHRIGQTRHVHCSTLYYEGTIEERIPPARAPVRGQWPRRQQCL